MRLIVRRRGRRIGWSSRWVVADGSTRHACAQESDLISCLLDYLSIYTSSGSRVCESIMSAAVRCRVASWV